MSNGVSRWPKAVSCSPTRPTAPPRGYTATKDSGDVAPAAWATMVSMAASSQGP